MYRDYEIVRYSTTTPIKSSYAERINKSLEDLLYKVMTAHQSLRWIDYVDKVVDIYNHRVSSVLHGLTPSEAHLPSNEAYLRMKFWGDYKKHKEKMIKHQNQRFFINDNVRVIKDKTIFSRGYEPAYEKEIRRVKDVIFSYPISYKVEGKQRLYYGPEMVLSRQPQTPQENIYYIDKTRTVNARKLRSGQASGGQKQYLLKDKNNPDQSSWISEIEYQRLKNGSLLRGIH